MVADDPMYEGEGEFLPRTVFFTAAVGDHRKFVLPYIYSVLRHDATAAVEIMVSEVASFAHDNRDALALFDKRRVLLRYTDWSDKDANYLRFLREPQTQAAFVYIGDVDILVLDRDVTDVHVANCKALSLPYSNILRPSGDRLSGLHFSEWDALYPIEPPPITALRRVPGDEHLLLQMIQQRGLSLPTGNFRPVHGIHMSVNRLGNVIAKDNPDLDGTWGVNRDRWLRYQELAAEPGWQALLPHFDTGYRQMLDMLESEAIAAFGAVREQHS